MLSHFGLVQLFLTLRTVAHQAPLSTGFSRQEYWSGLLSPPPGDLPNPGIKPRSSPLQVDSLLSEPPGKPMSVITPHLLPNCLPKMSLDIAKSLAVNTLCHVASLEISRISLSLLFVFPNKLILPRVHRFLVVFCHLQLTARSVLFSNIFTRAISSSEMQPNFCSES